MPIDLWPWANKKPGVTTATAQLNAELCESSNVNGNWTEADGGSCHASALTFVDFITSDLCKQVDGKWSSSSSSCIVPITSDICTKNFGGTWNDTDGGVCTSTVNGMNAKPRLSRRAPVIAERGLEQCTTQIAANSPEIIAIMVVATACIFGIFKFKEAADRRKAKAFAAAGVPCEKECKASHADCAHHGVGA